MFTSKGALSSQVLVEDNKVSPNILHFKSGRQFSLCLSGSKAAQSAVMKSLFRGRVKLQIWLQVQHFPHTSFNKVGYLDTLMHRYIWRSKYSRHSQPTRLFFRLFWLLNTMHTPTA